MATTMIRRRIHYEAAFADYLRGMRVPFVPIDETRRAVMVNHRVKSFDFLVYPGEGRHWIVDVKGRQFPYTTARNGKRYWENWVTREDLEGLAEWQEVFGSEFESRFVFTYRLQGPRERWPAGGLHAYRGQCYAFYGVSLADYERRCRPRSGSWQTVSVSMRDFRQIAAPILALAARSRRSHNNQHGTGPSPGVRHEIADDMASRSDDLGDAVAGPDLH